MAVLAGRGGNFCAGYDLKELAAMKSVSSVVGNYSEGTAPMVSYLCSVLHCFVCSLQPCELLIALIGRTSDMQLNPLAATFLV